MPSNPRVTSSGDENHREKFPKFDIRQHLDKLTPDGGSCNKGEQSYHCPLCNAPNLKVDIDGKKPGFWSTWGCDCAKSEAGKQKIKDTIAPLTWEKPIRPESSEVFTYDAQSGMAVFAICQVRRQDDGKGKRKFSQWSFNESRSKWVPELPDHIKTQVHLYRIFDPINQDALSKDAPILLVEGEGKVNKLHALGIAATCSIGGAGKWKQYGYENYLKDLAGANLVLCPDRDEVGIKHVEAIAEDFPEAKWLYPNPNSYMWSRQIPKNKGFDIADWIEGDGATAADILGAIGPKRSLILTSKTPEPSPPAAAIEPRAPSPETPSFGEIGKNRGMTTLQIDAEMIENEVGHLLRFDCATQNFYLDGDRLILGRERLILSRTYGLPIKIGKEDTMDICVELAQRNTFNSVTDYLEGCRNTSHLSLLDVAHHAFGATDTLQAVFVAKWLISAVARAYEPGCQADDVLILQGRQGQGKSSFFKELVPVREWFNGDGLRGGKINDEEIRKAQRVWIIEVGEIDKLFKKACASELKAFMTQGGDWLRQLYEKMPEFYPRNSIMAGSTNEPEFFTDDTGNRRYLVVQVMNRFVDRDWLNQNRDSIWAAARDAYKAGEQWHLTPEEKTAHEQQNKKWKIEHPWQGAIEHYLRHIDETTIPEILHDVIKLSLSELRGKSEQMQVSGILKSLGFTKISRRAAFMETQSPVWIRKPED